ncbi:MFS transporter [Nocardia stercoris]|uniref:MFS transporter n=1 Tax=Nocardia stercoris TaxID=2483361 RepID=UPI0018F794B8|nr:MFS transporter [Nocardia stercoris]
MKATGAAPAIALSPHPKRWAAAVVMIPAALLDVIDGSIINTALPSIGRGLGATPAELQWTVSAYLLGFAATLIVAGHLGDRFGRKGLFLAGLAGFAVSSLAGAVAAGPDQLIVARAAQGVAAAVIMPQVLGSLRVLFTGAERGKVFAIYGAIAGLAMAAGVVLGGVLTDWNLFGWGWRTIFAINVPLAAVLIVLGALWIPAARDHGPGRVGVVRAGALALSLAAIVLPLVQGRSVGWSLWGWLRLGAGVAGLAGLAKWQQVLDEQRPMLPSGLFVSRVFVAGLVVQLLFCGAMSGFMLILTIWLQSGQGYSPARAGLLMVAFSVGTFLAAPMVDGLVARFGRGVPAAGGLILVGGLCWVVRATGHVCTHAAAWPLVPGLLVAGTGLGLMVIPLADIMLTAVPEDLAGVASGVFITAQQFGGALGVAVIGNAFFARVGAGHGDAIGRAGQWSVVACAACAVLCRVITCAAIIPRAEADHAG